MRTNPQTQLTMVDKAGPNSSIPTQPNPPITKNARARQNSDHIFIPVDQQSTPIPTIPSISTRLSNFLACLNLRTFGKLHGLRLSEIRKCRRCGQHTIRELEAMVGEVGGWITYLKLRPRPIHYRPGISFPKLFSVSLPAQDVTPSDLPLSARADNSLRMLGIQRLRELEEVDRARLKAIRWCGARTILEIQSLLERAGRGEFSVTPEALKKMTAFDLLVQIDEGLGKLHEFNLEILALRLGGDGQPPATLKTIGAEMNITPERARQVVHEAVGKLDRWGGPKLKALLKKFGTSSQNLTPAIVRKWAPTRWPFRYKPVFYVRAIQILQPVNPVDPDCRKRGKRRQFRSEGQTRKGRKGEVGEKGNRRAAYPS